MDEKHSCGKYIPFAEYIKGKHVANSKLFKKILKEGLKERKCECCGNTTWNGVPIPLEVHHIDGDGSNNELDNLQLLCPNCHALTDNYCGKNIKKEALHVSDDDFVSALQNSANIKQALDQLGLPVAKFYYQRARKLMKAYGIVFEEAHTGHYCVDCGKPISNRAERCHKCSGRAQRHIDMLDREELKSLIRTTSFLQIGKQYGVSDNAIRKWCEKYNLPFLKKEIKNLTDEEWALI